MIASCLRGEMAQHCYSGQPATKRRNAREFNCRRTRLYYLKRSWRLGSGSAAGIAYAVWAADGWFTGVPDRSKQQRIRKLLVGVHIQLSRNGEFVLSGGQTGG